MWFHHCQFLIAAMKKDEAEAVVMDALTAWFVMDDAPSSLLVDVQCVMMKWSMIAMMVVK